MNVQESPSLLLDLVNSKIVWPDGERDEIGDDADGRSWLRAHDADGTPNALASARDVRPVLVAVLRGEAEADALQPWVEHMRKQAVLRDGTVEWIDDVPARHAVAVRAIEEWASLQTSSGSRIRPCADPECQHFLIDRSASNRRKWHSMDQCGNRVKARRHYARSKAATS